MSEEAARFIPPKGWLKWPTRHEASTYIEQENARYKRLYKLYKNLIKAILKKDENRIEQHLELAQSDDFNEYAPDEL